MPDFLWLKEKTLAWNSFFEKGGQYIAHLRQPLFPKYFVWIIFTSLPFSHKTWVFFFEAEFWTEEVKKGKLNLK